MRKAVSGIRSSEFVSTPAPAWARPFHPPDTEAEAGFLAGAAIARLDAIVRQGPSFSGAWRRRLALGAAAASVSRSGRMEHEAALRDSFHLTRAGADPGPAGRQLVAWRALTSGSAGQWRSAVGIAAEALEAPDDESLQSAIQAAEACMTGNRLAPFAAARAYHLVRQAVGDSISRMGPGQGEGLAAWLADAVLAQKLNWPFALPLLAQSMFSGGGRKAAAQTESAETMRILFAYAEGATQACDLAIDLGRRALTLSDAAPRLRAKGAGAALEALLEEDSLGAGTAIAGLSDRGARRLFDRLVAFGAVRELTGRPTFRLYGL